MQEPMLELKLGFLGELWNHLDLAPWMEEESRIKNPHTLTFMNPMKFEKKALGTFNPSFNLT